MFVTARMKDTDLMLYSLMLFATWAKLLPITKPQIASKLMTFHDFSPWARKNMKKPGDFEHLSLHNIRLPFHRKPDWISRREFLTGIEF